jgi:methylated-DNA-[protein]-cysteine S-methyltransferase
MSPTRTSSPLGPLTVAATPAGVVRIAFANEDHDAVVGELADRVSPRVLEAPGRLDAVRRELDLYFAGELTRFDVPIDWSLARGFRAEALAVCARIPYGSTRTYLAIAAEAGNPRAVRAVGSAMGTNPVPLIVPCHRVLRTDGGLGGYRGGLPLKERLLQLEGVER